MCRVKALRKPTGHHGNAKTPRKRRTNRLPAGFHSRVCRGRKKKKKFYPLSFGWKSCKRKGFPSVHVFVVAHVGVVGLHLALDHGLLAPAAGHHQADEESLQKAERGERHEESISFAPFEQVGKGFKGEEEAGSAADWMQSMEIHLVEKCSQLFLKKFLASRFFFF